MCYATSNMTQPRLRTHRPLPIQPTIADEEALNISLNSEWGPEFPENTAKQFDGMDAGTSKLFHRVRQLSSLASRLYASNESPDLQQLYTDRMLLFERQMIASIWSLGLNNIRQHGSPAQPRSSAAVRACTRTLHSTILTYLYVVLRQTPPNSQTVEKLTGRLKYSLQILTQDELWVHFPTELLLWMVVIAGTACAGRIEELWFCQLLIQVRHVLQLDFWEKAKEILVEYAWVDQICDRPCRAFWEQSNMI